MGNLLKFSAYLFISVLFYIPAFNNEKQIIKIKKYLKDIEE